MKRFADIKGASVVVTGAGSGIGRACAHSFARSGARVVVTDLLSDRVEEVVDELRGNGHASIGVPCDVTREEELEEARDACLAEFGRVDIIMNNVGVIAMGAPESAPLEAWQRVLDINLLGIVRSNRVFLPGLIAQGHGHVVNTASIAGLLAHSFDRLSYVASKHAVVGMSESLALYLRPRGIGVSCLCPAGVATKIVEQIQFYGEAGEVVSPGAIRAPAYAMVEAEEVGEAVVRAVREGRFLVLTDPTVLDELAERTRDIEAYLDRHSETGA